MLYEADISALLSQWQEIAERPYVDQSYKDGIRDCMYDLKSLINKAFEKEILYNEVLKRQMEEDYNSLIEAQNAVAA